MEDKKYLIQKRGIYIYKRRLPKEIREFDQREFIRHSLNTKDLATAIARRDKMNQEVEKLWEVLIDGDLGDTAREQFDRAVKRCRLLNFPYRNNKQILDGDLEDLKNRLHVIELHHSVKPVAQALLGTVKRPVTLLSETLDIHFNDQRGAIINKSDDQIRKWKNPRIKAIKNLINVIGDVNYLSVDYAAVLSFRDWWLDRIELEGLTANSANKDFVYAGLILKSSANKDRLEYQNPFLGIRLPEVSNKRPSMVQDEVTAIFKDSKFRQLDPAGREIIAVMAECGTRTNEIAGLDPLNNDVVLNHDIPHISIRPNQYRDIKTISSRRDIPLVGHALEMARETGFQFCQKYAEVPDRASGFLNDYFRKHNLFPTDQHTIYSLRHAFKDRLDSVGTPEAIRRQIMGHAEDGAQYGQGVALKIKKGWMDKACLI